MTDAPPNPPSADALAPAAEYEDDRRNEEAWDQPIFDPADYDWIPVRREPRADGWSEEKQRTFIAELADTGSVARASRAVGMSRRSAYALRRAVDGAGFAHAWDVAIRHAMHGLLDVVTERAIEGTEEPIVNRHGKVLAHRRRFNDRLAMFLLCAHMPERCGVGRGAGTTRDGQGAVTQSLPPGAMAAAIARLDPATPAEPHLLCPPDDLESLLDLADLNPGEMPRAYRDATLRPVYEPSEEEERLRAQADAILSRAYST